MKAISKELRALLENAPRVIRCAMCHGKGSLDGMKCGACGGVGIDRIEQAKGEA
jgi:DnaJ-class molecular chaperone